LKRKIKENGQQSRKSLENGIYHSLYVGDFQKNEDFSFSENNLNIK
jgi:hypothetical protein